ncbi:AIPR family protein [Bacillus sp. SG-1]|uniref:AIPR family protein n=1 Tax=Bacillus sp. SG-1 TaxID=161544 RepID=UPI0002E7A782|nr:AIPR family protein [Bacillus sp. SG-1]
MQKEKLVLRIKSVGYRHIPNPYGEYDENKILNPQTYQAYVDVKDIPDNFPMETNPREQKLNTKTAKSIKDSLIDESDLNFQLKNRGILLTAESVTYDSHKKEMVITMSDMTYHGNVDGGHTYKLIKQHKNDVNGPKYVKIEVITNSEDIFQELAAARNTSVQVQDKSIAELENKFFLLKDSMPRNIVNEIAFKENDIKRIPVENIIAILSCFDISAYGDNNQPVSAYSAKGTMIKRYLKYFKEYEEVKQYGNPFHAMKNIIPSILDLYDHLECNISNYYVKGSKNGRFGAVKGVKTGNLKSELYGNKIDHGTPKGLILPIVAAFRTLVKEDAKTGYYTWKADPIKYLEILGPDLVYSTVERSRTLGNNPNAAGKDAQHWKSLYFEVNNKYLNDRLAELDA